METGIISDGQISASSEASAIYAAIQGRLHFQETVDIAGGWAAATNDANQWLQVDLGRQLAKVTRVATQGRNGPYIQLVTKYKLQYSNDGVNFQNYTEQKQNIDKDLTGNTDQDTVVYHVLNPPIRARYIRFRPVAWYGWISMRVELYGCLQDSCRSLKFASPVDGFALEGHVIKNISLHTGMRSSCIGRCSIESKCTSFNIGPQIDNHVMCQLSNSDHMRHPGDLKPKEGFTYRATESPCSSNPCFNNGTCVLKGLTDKKYVCMCQTGYRGERCEIGKSNNNSVPC
ncbi:EGF-like repeat and discoidin I-like domain-containing protein 3 [Orbicella faveolata]|uniref:EGF-like repeat and discoidin I-like domain-containing protein 3 n=1 Tax=Orbicella faveolata TaxID=48498 RepID=UPI0009E45245|nr:EGF-like repeat and discoidin I-like domain-containing protein 3 [Orbicella faveolata]